MLDLVLRFFVAVPGAIILRCSRRLQTSFWKKFVSDKYSRLQCRPYLPRADAEQLSRIELGRSLFCAEELFVWPISDELDIFLSPYCSK